METKGETNNSTEHTRMYYERPQQQNFITSATLWYKHLAEPND